MKKIVYVGINVLLPLTVSFVVLIIPAKCIRPQHSMYHGKDTFFEDQTHTQAEADIRSRNEARVEELYPTGSSLPDCSHACGPCSPCKRVMVSFKCSISVSEPCPVVYRCMCHGRFYHVPSN
ncbi:Epidermal patterning factor-like protein [Heracleum sosnowskyi]|uniref:Epidermal patterning factor-like protein n=1 Tax=Heracleum sosnowskyi TaxID=360622 RepID=A0AAD8JJR5_9APIA|nr:Epidermal patterning factor-like protein [Heracleum sosnowskyi]